MLGTVLWMGMLLRISVGSPSGVNPFTGFMAVAVGVDELLVDPVAAALRKLLDVQFARGEHDLTHGAVDFIAIDVDVGEVVVRTDFLNLPQGVLKCAPVP